MLGAGGAAGGAVVSDGDHTAPRPPSPLLKQWKLLGLILADKRLAPADKHVAYWLLDHRNAHTGRCDPSIGRLPDKTGLDERSVTRALATLERKWLRRELRPGRTTYYVFTEPDGFAGPMVVKKAPPTKSSGVPRPNGPPSPDRFVG